MNGDFGVAGRVVENLGSAGLILFVLWKLIDKWAGRFLDAQKAQGEAMAGLAQAVRETAGAAVSAAEAQRELLMAVRVLSTEQHETKQWLVEWMARIGTTR